MIDMPYLDFLKACGLLLHIFLLDKPQMLDFNLTVFLRFKIFLIRRTLSVSVSGIISHSKLVTSYVKQISVFRSHFFYIYVSFITGAMAGYRVASAAEFKLCVCYSRKKIAGY